MNEKAAVARTDADAPVVVRGRRPVPRHVLAAFDALALHDARAADPLDGAGIEPALEWEWERAEHGIPEGTSREDLVAVTEAPTSRTGRDEKGREGAERRREEAA